MRRMGRKRGVDRVRRGCQARRSEGEEGGQNLERKGKKDSKKGYKWIITKKEIST